ncbi:putative WD40/YVTN repeat-like-containing domain-containing protein [Rosa chinensis]|uniref:Putative WD40/YVTN repeat-like-containing domain-containing protein n=1 Tax=Rosa chinensis TaxID=74649 RepID=A0A2P6RGH6_ROSCH|nr:putative WD40/YVTN repeat-like-containing domain-containing protein [Rosa chinensis]
MHVSTYLVMELMYIPCYYWSAVSKLNNKTASWDTKFETGTKSILLEPFSRIVIAADESERIRVWNYQETKEVILLNSFDNHDFPDKGISKLCFVNELDESLLLAASSKLLHSEI